MGVRTNNEGEIFTVAKKTVAYNLVMTKVWFIVASSKRGREP